MKKINIYASGFTLVELLLYMGLLAVFLVVLTDIFVSALNVQTSSESASAVLSDGQYILARLAYDAGQSQDIATPSASGQNLGTLSFVENGALYTYSVTNGNLNLTSGGVTNSLNSSESSISSFSATRIASSGVKPTVQVNFTLRGISVPVQGPSTETFRTTLGVR